MARIGVLAPPYPGHLDPLRALARELARRGHECVLVQQPEAAPAWRGPGLRFEPIGATSHPPGSLEAAVARMAVPAWRGLRPVLRDVAASARTMLREAPAALVAARVDGVLADQAQYGAALAGALAGVPVVATATALPLDREPGLPPPWLGWAPAADAAGRARIDSAWRIVDRVMRPVEDAVDEALAERRTARGALAAAAAPRATLAQSVDALDFPRAAPPPGFAALGPWRSDDERVDQAALAALDDEERPLVFCSLGTLQGSRAGLFEAIAGACGDLGLCAVVAHGGRLDPRRAAALPGRPRVFAHVPQRALLPRCAAAVLHGGFNTVLDALAAGVPIVAVPLAFEQPGTAARLRRAGVATVVGPPALASRARIRDALAATLGGAHRARARELAAAIAAAGGVRAAADRVEAALGIGSGGAVAGRGPDAATPGISPDARAPAGPPARPGRAPEGATTGCAASGGARGAARSGSRSAA